MLKLTKNQSTWFENATDQEQKAFMRKGPAEVAQFFNIKTEKESFAPAVRGVRIAGTTEDINKAQKYAEEFLDKLQQEDLPVLDEYSLGIDGSSVTQAETCYEKDLRIEGVLHLGSLLATDAFEGRCLENLHDEFIDILISESIEIEESMKPLRPSFDDEELNDDVGSLVADFLLSHNFQGFAVYISCPVKKYHSDTSASYSWGWKRTSWVYGESFEEAFKNATAWADRMKQIDLDKFKAKQEETETN
ncbi:hypothetical protein GZ77_07305 [Endozoicomonas montiporae]|uniref:Uncharacterized protein n=2 Tax=Endozoicomonas montiporae TaxID=1027273 RepID=A0A081N700_9GAMM|nr:hypothetical protein [Endozoicomonas montiporae]AMO55969.1 hypothetical protein EZMO1_1826 [Endozoicomonas montiporae CL-33]KEQ14223.1 hypothetical protein GZ77_07305 [Endozoicomonas montiporae]